MFGWRSSIFAATLALISQAFAQQDHLEFAPAPDGPGQGQHVVLLAGDEEYRSEEAMPMLAQLLARQGFTCTVLFSLDENGQIDPGAQESLSYPQALDEADLLVTSLRFRHWDDATMERFDAALKRGTPLVALRTSTHAFKFPEDSRWHHYSFNAGANSQWSHGFGGHWLGDTWRSHHGHHAHEGTRTRPYVDHADHPILRGVGEIFVESDVYEVHPPDDATLLLQGLVTETLEADSAVLEGPKNNPPMPVAWTREFSHEGGPAQRIVTTTMGAASDFTDANLRRLVVNAVFWGLNLEVPAQVDVTLEGNWQPTFYGFGQSRQGAVPEDFRLESTQSPAEDDQRNKSEPAAESRNQTEPSAQAALIPELARGSRICLIGGGLGARMDEYGWLETEVHSRFPEHELTLRNLCRSGDTPCFRPHPGRALQFAFPGAEEFVREEFRTDPSDPSKRGFFETPDEWLTRLQPDIVLAFFGFSSSFGGPEDLPRFEGELAAFLEHSLSQPYGPGGEKPQFVLCSPTAFENRSADFRVPNGIAENHNLELYTEAMSRVATEYGMPFVDLFHPTLDWFSHPHKPLTVDGAQLGERGYQRLAPLLANAVFGPAESRSPVDSEALHELVLDKNWIWSQDFRIPNGVHVYGQRNAPFGAQNYPDELIKTRQLTANRDQAIHALLRGQEFDLAAADAATLPLPPIETNYAPSGKTGTVEYRNGTQALEDMSLPEGYRAELFADESQFNELANPVQMSFDNQGRLWVAVMPTYPHWRPGDPRPNDKLLVFTDSNGDGHADEQFIYADGLHLITGFELCAEGVIVASGGKLILLADDNGDGRCDRREILVLGLDQHDSHHSLGAFCADPEGGILGGQGVFLSTHVETARGTIHATNGSFMRYVPARREMQTIAQLNIPNPWGIAFDTFGQPFFLFTSSANAEWMSPGQTRPRYGVSRNNRGPTLLTSNQVRPTSGLEILSSRHFPDELQGDLLINNTIGYLGIKEHSLSQRASGFQATFRQDLLSSTDGNFRPVDLEIGPDGALYLIDWSNALIGHMQHSARDPLRDHAHGRIYRIVHTDRPLVEPAEIAGAPIATLLDNLHLPELRSRYRTRRELRGRDAKQVCAATLNWLAALDPADPELEQLRLEAHWVLASFDRPDSALFAQLLGSADFRVRAAAIHSLRHHLDQLPGSAEILRSAAADPAARVRLEAVVGASWLDPRNGEQVLEIARQQELDPYLTPTLEWAEFALAGPELPAPNHEESIEIPEHLDPAFRAAYRLGYEVFRRDAHCSTCHQKTGLGFEGIYPPLIDSDWVEGNPERLAKLVMNGLHGPLEVDGLSYGVNTPPMPAFQGLIPDDEELAAVLTYVRNSWGNQAEPVPPELISKVRAEVAERIEAWTPAELSALHPDPDSH